MGTEVGRDQVKDRRGETRTGTDGDQGQIPNMQQKRGESQKEQWDLGLWAVGAVGVVRKDRDTWRGWGRKPRLEHRIDPSLP